MVKSSNAYKRQSGLLLAYWLDRPQADNQIVAAML